MKQLRQPTTASYLKSGISHYDGNPLIEALPPIMSLDDATAVLSRYPAWNEDELSLPPHIRRHCVGKLFGLVQAAPIYIDCLWSFDELLRGGYVGRRFWSAAYQRHLYEVRNKTGLSSNSDFAATSGVLLLQGPSGQGKSTLVDRILSCYPQVIQHTAYDGRKFLQPQVVWLKIACPHDGSLKQLCIAFFEALDLALGTGHALKYRNSRVGIPVLMGAMRQLCATYCIGVIVIDELQHLSLAKAGGRRNMMNFFVNLINDVGVPMMLIGTYAASSLFQYAMRDARRATGDGLKDFRRPSSKDKWWNLLLETAWEYQWTKEKVELSDDIRTDIYNWTQGISDFLIKLLVLSQRRALRLNRERVTIGDLRSVANNELALLKPAIAALRKNTVKSLSLYEDLLPTKEEMQKHLDALERASAETADEVMAALQAQRRGANRPGSGPSAEASVEELNDQPQETAKVAEIKAVSAMNSLMASLGKASVSGDLKARSLIVEALA